MAISPYLAALRAKVGNDLLVLPSVAVVPIDGEGRVLLVQNADTHGWQTLGGAVEPDEAPRDAAVREAYEEASVEVELVRLLDVLGGPQYRVAYPNGDTVSYVTTVFEARVVAGTPTADGDETSDAAWFGRDDLAGLPVSGFTRALIATLPDGLLR
ncbi:MAG TPA: NUDIX domain-containing protein [Acidimicrobiales bacterium]|nr:NUDIX domain-containing protein [Acidimicrobiales bacterium]